MVNLSVLFKITYCVNLAINLLALIVFYFLYLVFVINFLNLIVRFLVFILVNFFKESFLEIIFEGNGINGNQIIKVRDSFRKVFDEKLSQ